VCCDVRIDCSHSDLYSWKACAVSRLVSAGCQCLVLCFSRGQLGHGDLENEQEIARQVDSLAGLRVVLVAAGGWHSSAVTECGDLYTWGWNQSGQLGFCTGKVIVSLS
jgi:alpha-tubulin suppressor-like RCC1 family protein